MGISLKPEHLKRYKDVAWLLVKYGRSDLVKHAGLEDVLTDRAPISTELVPQAKALADDLERMGPTFVKLGQLLSTRADLLPLPYLQALLFSLDMSKLTGPRRRSRRRTLRCP